MQELWKVSSWAAWEPVRAHDSAAPYMRLLLLTALTHNLNPAPPCAATYSLQAPEALSRAGKLTSSVDIYSPTL